VAIKQPTRDVAYYQVQNRDQAYAVYSDLRYAKKTSMDPFEMHEQATALGQGGSWAKALKLEARALAKLRKKLDKNDPNLAIGLTNLATYHAEVGQWKEALPLYEEGLAIKVATAGSADPSLTGTIFRLARCQKMLGDGLKAVDLYFQCIEIFDAHPHANPSLQLTALEELAVLLQEEGRSPESVGVLLQTIRLTAPRVWKGERELYTNLRNACLGCISEQDSEGAADALSEAFGLENAWRLLGDLAHDLIEQARPQHTNVPDPPDDVLWRAEHDEAMKLLGRAPPGSCEG